MAEGQQMLYGGLAFGIPTLFYILSLFVCVNGNGRLASATFWMNAIITTIFAFNNTLGFFMEGARQFVWGLTDDGVKEVEEFLNGEMGFFFFQLFNGLLWFVAFGFWFTYKFESIAMFGRRRMLGGLGDLASAAGVSGLGSICVPSAGKNNWFYGALFLNACLLCTNAQLNGNFFSGQGWSFCVLTGILFFLNFLGLFV